MAPSRRSQMIRLSFMRKTIAFVGFVSGTLDCILHGMPAMFIRPGTKQSGEVS